MWKTASHDGQNSQLQTAVSWSICCMPLDWRAREAGGNSVWIRVLAPSVDSVASLAAMGLFFVYFYCQYERVWHGIVSVPCRFIYLFIGVGAVVFLVSLFGCIGAGTRNTCCLCFVSSLVCLLDIALFSFLKKMPFAMHKMLKSKVLGIMFSVKFRTSY